MALVAFGFLLFQEVVVMLESLWFRVASFNLLLSVDWDQGIDRILAPRAAWLHGFRILLCLGVCFLVGLSDCLRSLGIDRLVSVPSLSGPGCVDDCDGSLGLHAAFR